MLRCHLCGCILDYDESQSIILCRGKKCTFKEYIPSTIFHLIRGIGKKLENQEHELNRLRQTMYNNSNKYGCE